MLKKGVHHIILMILLGIQAGGYGQSGFYVPSQGKIFFTGDTATIFSNVLNGGKLGVGVSAVVNFKGRIWENEPHALLTDESNRGEGSTGVGGIIRFLATDTTRQYIYGGYNAVSRLGPGFPNLQVQNTNGIRLLGSTTKVRNELRMTSGLLYLDNQILVVGNEYNAGRITGYDSSRFLVTGNAPGTGILLRENVTANDQIVVFPIGSHPHQYTPAAVRTQSNTAEDFYATVFDSVRSLVTSGTSYREISVNKTWQMGKRFRPNGDEVDVFLQHLVDEEGSIFRAGRRLSYISRYQDGVWDTAAPLIQPQPGYLTTGPFQLNAGLNKRTLPHSMPGVAYYSKFVGRGDRGLNQTIVWLSGYRIDNHQVRVAWTTNPEINNNYFVVQRRFSNETNFSNIDTVVSKAVNGISRDFLNYTLIDPNSYTGITYYRLMLVDFNGRETFSNIVPVGRITGEQFIVWPNPSSGRFFVGVGASRTIKSIVVFNVLGQKLREEPVRDRNIIPMYLPIPGTYVIGFVSFGNRIIQSEKLLVRGYE